MKRIDDLLSEYAEAHRAPGNVACHTIGISLIVFGVLSMLHALPIAGPLTGSEALIAAASIWYLSLDAWLGLGMVAAGALFDLLARLVADWRVGAAAFVVGWIFQAIGHAAYEKKSPAFFRNFVHLLVGPAFLVNKLLHVRPVGPPAG